MQDITGAERGRYGIDHALIGGLLARNWCMPKELWLPVSLHHVREHTFAAAGPSTDSSHRLIATGVLADAVTRLQRGQRGSALAEAEQAYALRILGIGAQQLASLRTDIALLLAAP